MSPKFKIAVSFATQYLSETITALSGLNDEQLERCVQMLADLRETHGRLFVLGVGGSAANASHAVNDFRKLCGIEAYAPTDNVAELTARTNDEGWHTTFDEWLITSHLTNFDMLLVLSVGGGSMSVSPNIANAVEYAQETGARILSIVGRPNGAAAQFATEAIIIPEVNAERVTAHAEECQAIIWHLMANHPLLRLA